jgi:DNA-binding transcriptional MerR regulator
MRNHGDERPSDHAPDRCTIGELAEQVGMTVRNIRAYQARGLLPPPLVDGRVGFYTETHRERLRMIRRLRSEGFNLVAISALLTGVVPVTTSVTALAAADPGSPGRTPGLPEAGAALLALGVPVDAVLALHREVAGSVDQIASAYRRVLDEYVRKPWLAVGSPVDRRERVDEATAALPAIAAAAVTATLIPAVREAIDNGGVPLVQEQHQAPSP